MIDERKITAEVACYNELKRRLKDTYGDENLTDTLEGETNLHELIGSTLREANENAAMVKALDGMIETLSVRQSRLENKRLRLRELAAWAMAECGLTKLPFPDMTVTLAAGRPKIDIDENMVDLRFMTEIKKLVIDKAAIKAEVDAGRVPYGVRTSNSPPTLQVRTK